MAFEPYEALWLVKETNFGTTKTSPTAGTDSIYIRLAGANRSTLRSTKRQLPIAFGGGYAVRGYTVADRWEAAGNLEVELTYTQAALLMGWSITRINAGRTTPWTTSSSTIGNLASMTVYHAIMRSDGTVKRVKYLGAVVRSWKLMASAQTGLTMLTLGLVAQKHAGNADDSSSDPDATEFPLPADTAFPTDPVLFTHFSGSGGLTIGSSELTCFEGFSLSGDNVIDARYCAGSKFLSFADFRGRKVTGQANVLFTATPNWRSDFDTQTLKTVEAVWTDGTTTLTIDMYDANIITGVDDDLTPGQVYNQNLSFESQRDTSDGGEIAVTVA
jgi:hypothetical protein